MSEHERFLGVWPDGDYAMAASVAVGLLFDERNATARAFAEKLKVEAPPRGW